MRGFLLVGADPSGRGGELIQLSGNTTKKIHAPELPPARAVKRTEPTESEPMSKKPADANQIVAGGLEERMTALDAIAKDCQLTEQVGDQPFTVALKTADAIVALRKQLEGEAIEAISELMNTPLGFLTDRTGKGNSKQPYTPEELIDPVIEATLRGFHVVGNEFNIIASRFYAAKAGLRRKVLAFPGLSEFKDKYGIPRIHADKGGAIVTSTVSWKLNGVEDSMEGEFAIKGDAFAGADSYVGKAERKTLKRVLDRLTGKITPDGDVDEIPELGDAPAGRSPDAPAPDAAATTKPVKKTAAEKKAEAEAVAAAARGQAETPLMTVTKTPAVGKTTTIEPEPASPPLLPPPLPSIAVVSSGDNYRRIMRAIEKAGVSEEEICESAYQSITITDRPEGMLVAAAPVEQIAVLANSIDAEVTKVLKHRERKAGGSA